VASKADSMDLCFLAGTGRAAFLARHGGARERPGDIVDRRGHVLGRHRGHHGFTVGQRKGIGVAAPEPLYVLATDARTNRVTVGGRADLATRDVAVRGARLHRPADEVDSVRLRYRSKPLACSVAEEGRGRLTLHLSDPADAAAPGQTACLYRGDVIVGYGTIS
jgi:tRNA-specific 2-thiouridylase